MPLCACSLEVLVHVFYHHDCRIHHGADGDGDAAQRHDVGGYALAFHDDEDDFRMVEPDQ